MSFFGCRRLSQRPTAEELEQRNILQRKLPLYTHSSYCIVIYLPASVLFCPFFLVSLVTHLFLFIYSLCVHWGIDTDPHIFYSLSLLVSYAGRHYWYFCFSQLSRCVLVCDVFSVESEIRSTFILYFNALIVLNQPDWYWCYLSFLSSQKWSRQTSRGQGDQAQTHQKGAIRFAHITFHLEYRNINVDFSKNWEWI